jgi:hypothetical protein
VLTRAKRLPRLREKATETLSGLEHWSGSFLVLDDPPPTEIKNLLQINADGIDEEGNVGNQKTGQDPWGQ